MKRNRLLINQSEGLNQIKNDLRQMLKEQRTLALDELEKIADIVYFSAVAKVPVDTGTLQDSIQVDVSRSPRYPGLIVYAEAHNVRTGYDYALIQEENEGYNHPNGGQAHFLRDAFEEGVEEFYRRMGW